jgi:hypothetical protein
MVNLEFPNCAAGIRRRLVRNRTLLKLTATMQAHIMDVTSAFSAPAKRPGLFLPHASEKPSAARV